MSKSLAIATRRKAIWRKPPNLMVPSSRIKEIFPGGFSIENRFDLQGSKLFCQIPAADCRIEYVYHAKDLVFVSRKTLSGQMLYAHQYQERDLAGNLLREELIDGSPVCYSVDLLSRKTKINSLPFTQEVLEYDAVGNIRCCITQNQNSSFAYDDLYQLTAEKGPFTCDYGYDSMQAI